MPGSVLSWVYAHAVLIACIHMQHSKHALLFCALCKLDDLVDYVHDLVRSMRMSDCTVAVP